MGPLTADHPGDSRVMALRVGASGSLSIWHQRFEKGKFRHETRHPGQMFRSSIPPTKATHKLSSYETKRLYLTIAAFQIWNLFRRDCWHRLLLQALAIVIDIVCGCQHRKLLPRSCIVDIMNCYQHLVLLPRSCIVIGIMHCCAMLASRVWLLTSYIVVDIVCYCWYHSLLQTKHGFST